MEPSSAPLRADCERCFGLCCTALGFVVSADFALDKPAGQPCPNLEEEFRCGIHPQLRERGFVGCTTFDCFGAGQQVSQVTFGGRSWREAPETAAAMFAVLPVMRGVHELRWYVSEALTYPGAEPLAVELRRAQEGLGRLSGASADELLGPCVAEVGRDVQGLLARVSELVRAAVRNQRLDRQGADLVGARLVGADLRAANLRGALLIGATLRGADLRWADVMGADLRAADLRGADLSNALFLTQSQLDAARGDAATRLPAARSRPAQWESSRPQPRTARRRRR